jgi:hypothetical protein
MINIIIFNHATLAAYSKTYGEDTPPAKKKKE